MDLQTVTSKGKRYARNRRVGRGTGSGRGKTCGRGHKGWGQRSGSSRRPGYEGGQMPIYRRVPKRGFTNARFRTEYTVVNVEALNAFADGAEVDLTAILERGLTSLNTPLLKVLGNGELTTKLTIRAQKFSASAAAKIEAAGGTAVVLDSRQRAAGDTAATDSGADDRAQTEAPAGQEAADTPAEATNPEPEATEGEEADS